MRRLALALAVLLLSAACGGGDGDADDASAPSSTTSSTEVATTAAGEATTDTTPSAPGDSPTGTAAPAPSGDAGAATDPGADPEASPETAGPAPIPPGTYRYRQSGRTTAGPQSFETPPEGKAVVDPPTAEGNASTQAVHRYVDPEGEPSDTWLRFTPDAILLYELVLRQRGMETSCVFEPAVAVPAWPPTVGATSEGHADCDSIDVDLAMTITGRTPVTLDGQSYEAYVMESTITTTGNVESTTEQVDHFVAELRLVAHSESSGSGTFGQIEFESTSTSDLVSAVPE